MTCGPALAALRSRAGRRGTVRFGAVQRLSFNLYPSPRRSLFSNAARSPLSPPPSSPLTEFKIRWWRYERRCACESRRNVPLPVPLPMMTSHTESGSTCPKTTCSRAAMRAHNDAPSHAGTRTKNEPNTCAAYEPYSLNTTLRWRTPRRAARARARRQPPESHHAVRARRMQRAPNYDVVRCMSRAAAGARASTAAAGCARTQSAPS